MVKLSLNILKIEFIILGNFLKLWQGKILNIHQSLLPAFDTADTCKEVLNMKARITGCTVYFEEVYSTLVYYLYL